MFYKILCGAQPKFLPFHFLFSSVKTSNPPRNLERPFMKAKLQLEEITKRDHIEVGYRAYSY